MAGLTEVGAVKLQADSCTTYRSGLCNCKLTVVGGDCETARLIEVCICKLAGPTEEGTVKLQSGRTHRGVQLQAGGCHIINEEGGGGGYPLSFLLLFPPPSLVSGS